MTKTNIYSWNAATYSDKQANFTQDELLILEKSMDYKDRCEYNGKFLLLGNLRKKVWFYSITNYIPTPNYIPGIYQSIWNFGVSDLAYFDKLNNYDCLIYYYENKDIEIDTNKYNILYENNAGSIIEKIR